MDRWRGVLRVSLNPNYNNTRVYFNVAASLCFSPSSKTLIVPSANVIFFNGDRVEGTGNPVIEKLSDRLNIVDILISKLGLGGVSSSINNAWVVEASTFNGPFAVYKEFLNSVNSRGDPKAYDPCGFPASTSTQLLLSRCLEEAQNEISGTEQEPSEVKAASPSCLHQPKTIIIGFSKGGIVLNQLVTELAHSKFEQQKPAEGNQEEIHQIIPNSKESLLSSITEVHYVDVGLNSTGAYLTDASVIEKITNRIIQGASGIRFALHGTPRQWCDNNRPWIRNEKDKLLQLLKDAVQKTKGKLQPSLQLHGSWFSAYLSAPSLLAIFSSNNTLLINNPKQIQTQIILTRTNQSGYLSTRLVYVYTRLWFLDEAKRVYCRLCSIPIDCKFNFTLVEFHFEN